MTRTDFCNSFLRFLALASLTLLAGSAVGKEKPSDSAVCMSATAAAEKLKAIPPRLMQAVALVESGRREVGGQARTAWPWTINAEGAGQFFATKQEAVAAVAALQARGVKSIDVGCMQVNLLHHRDAFATLDEAFDPITNVAYAATFLAALREAKRSWDQAVRHYHSATPERHEPYWRKVALQWEAEKANIAAASAAAPPPAAQAPPSPNLSALRPGLGRGHARVFVGGRVLHVGPR